MRKPVAHDPNAVPHPPYIIPLHLINSACIFSVPFLFLVLRILCPSGYPLLPLSLSLSLLCPFISLELANSQETLEGDSSSTCGVVRALYEALGSRDVDTVHGIVAPDLEWWFHGPPTHQFLMRLLTGDSEADASFVFVPDSITSVDASIVLAEGCDQTRSIYWAHAWTVTNGIITQVREYFNTSLTVTRLGDASRSSPPPSEIVPAGSQHCLSVWESSLSSRVGKSVPGLVLAI